MNDITIILGALPPPMGGAAKNTKIIADEVSAMTRTVVLNTSVGAFAHDRSFLYHVKRVLKTVECSIRIIFNSLHKEKVIYIVPDGGLGLLYTAFYCCVSLLCKFKVVFHHRTFLYIDRKNGLMNFCCRLLGDKLSHIFLSPGMRDRFSNVYPVGYSSIISDNARFVFPEYIDKSTSGGIVLGYLSNLCDEKGFYEVLDTHSKLKSLNINTKLIIAGAPVNESVKADLHKFLEEFGTSTEYLNHIDGKQKADFYRRVNYFLFPTKFKQEAQPNVVYEAMSKSCVCISWGRACVPEMYSASAGLVVPIDRDFVEDACGFIVSSHIDNVYKEYSKNAYTEILLKQKESVEQYKVMLSFITGINHEGIL